MPRWWQFDRGETITLLCVCHVALMAQRELNGDEAVHIIRIAALRTLS